MHRASRACKRFLGVAVTLAPRDACYGFLSRGIVLIVTVNAATDVRPGAPKEAFRQ